MYMDLLEQEVEALGAEVTRLRLMVHRVTQVMEAPIPGHRVPFHADPSQVSPSVDHSNASDLQATVDSYKQILPLVQLLLAQQQRSETAGSDSKRRSRRATHRHHNRGRHGKDRRDASSSSSSSSSRTPTSPVSSTRRSLTTASSSQQQQQRSQKRRSDSHGHAVREQVSVTRAASASPSPPSARALAEQQAAAEPHAALTSPHQHSIASPSLAGRRRSSGAALPASVQPPPDAAALRSASISIMDRLRAQHQHEAAAEREDSSDSSNVMPMVTSLTRPTATGHPSPTPRRQYVMSASTTPSTTKPGSAKAGASGKLHQPPSEREFEHRGPARSGAEEPSRHSTAALPPGADASNTLFESSRSSNRVSERAGGSAVDSVLLSGQGIYNYSAIASAFSSPATSHVPEETGAASSGRPLAHAALASMSSAAGTSLINSLPQLPAAAESGLARQPGHGSASGGGGGAVHSSSSSSAEDASQVQNALLATIPTPYRAGSLILGARLPIAVQAASSPSASVATAVSGRGDSQDKAVAAASALQRTGPAASTTAAATLRTAQATGGRPNRSSTSTSSSSSDDAAAAFHHPISRRPTETHHRDSSFHDYSATAASPQQPQQLLTPDARTRSSPAPLQDPSASQSHDAYSFAAYSLQYSAQHSPPPQDIDASPNSSRALSHSMSPHQSARSVSLGGSVPERRGSIAAGGYYYGYDFGAGSPSQPSMASSRVGEA
ncbi:hypothetical protein NESM_000319500 [Novymonas esmeraldas]|uniref:Uncharacterized protein n=1 Tax=Novymonas esmeraldas TaxID=1808958 RepID=A0AAW0EIT1_9TRYP